MYKMLYTFTYMAIGSMTPLIGYYLNGLGFSGSQIGVVTATGTAVAVFAVIFWGRVYSHRRNKALVVELLCGCAMVMAALILGTKAFAVVLVIYGAMYFFQAPIMSLVDAFTVLGTSKGSFGSKRAWGAVGFAAGVVLSGQLVAVLDNRVIFLLYILFYGLAALSMMLIARKGNREGSMPLPAERTDTAEKANTAERIDTAERKDTTEKTDASEPNRFGYRDLLKSKTVVKLLICMFFFGGTNVANNTFFSFLYIEGGGTVAGVGVVMLLMVGSEIPFMYLCEKLSTRFGMRRLILYVMIISVVRFVLYGLGLPWWLLAALFVSQGIVNGILLVEFVRYIAEISPPGCESLGVSAYYSFGSNISTIVCQLIGGVLLQSFGASSVYMFFGLFNLTGAILYYAFRLYK